MEAVPIIAGLENVAAVSEPIEQGRGRLGVHCPATHACTCEWGRRPCPFAEAEVGGDDNAGPFAEFAENVEQ